MDRRDVFEAVLDRFEILNRLADLRRLAAHEHSGANARQHVFPVVRTFERDFADQPDLALAVGVAKQDLAVANPRALLHFLLAAEPEHLRPRAFAERVAGRVILVQNGEVVGLLVFEDPGFRVHVGLEGAVAIQMVGSNVQNDCDFWPKSLNGFELEAGNFQDDDRVLPGFGDQRDRWRSDVAANGDRQASGREDLAGQRGGRCFAVRSCDGNDRAGKVLGGEFDLADYGFAQGARLHERGSVDGHSWADDDQVLSAECALTMASGFDRDAVIEEDWDFVAELIGGLRVGNGDTSATILEEQGGSNPRLAKADDEDAFVFEVHEGQFLPQRIQGNAEEILRAPNSLAVGNESLISASALSGRTRRTPA